MDRCLHLWVTAENFEVWEQTKKVEIKIYKSKFFSQRFAVDLNYKNMNGSALFIVFTLFDKECFVNSIKIMK